MSTARSGDGGTMQCTERQEIALPGAGRLEIERRTGEVTWHPEAGGAARRFPDHPLATCGGTLRSAAQADGAALLLGHVDGAALHLLRPRRGELRAIPLGDRLRHSEELALVAREDGFLAITESGVYAIDPDGRERWRIAQTTWGWRFVGDEDGGLWLSDATGNLLCFDLSTGRER